MSLGPPLEPPDPPSGDADASVPGEPAPPAASRYEQGRRRGRRYNGVAAPAYVPLIDVDPRMIEPLLQALAGAGVGAFVEPSPGSVGGWLEMRLPDRPTDRLWVDPERRSAARLVVSEQLRELEASLADESGRPASSVTEAVPPGPPDARTPDPSPAADSGNGTGMAGPRMAPVDEEEAWRAIVAGWQRDAEAPVPPWPVAEDVEGTRAPEAAEPPSVRRRIVRPADPGPPAEADDDEHYAPPPPPPVPKASRHTLAACAAMVFGVLLLFAPGVLGQRGSEGTSALGVAGIVGGAATLVWRMRDAPPTDSGPDDGAVV